MVGGWFNSVEVGEMPKEPAVWGTTQSNVSEK